MNFLYHILCILMRWTRISTQNFKKISFGSRFGRKTDHFPPNLALIVRLGRNDPFFGQNGYQMIFFWYSELIFVFSASKYIGYDIKKNQISKFYFWPFNWFLTFLIALRQFNLINKSKWLWNSVYLWSKSWDSVRVAASFEKKWKVRWSKGA